MQKRVNVTVRRTMVNDNVTNAQMDITPFQHAMVIIILSLQNILVFIVVYSQYFSENHSEYKILHFVSL